jgi:hypothetical protein
MISGGVGGFVFWFITDGCGILVGIGWGLVGAIGGAASGYFGNSTPAAATAGGAISGLFSESSRGTNVMAGTAGSITSNILKNDGTPEVAANALGGSLGGALGGITAGAKGVISGGLGGAAGSIAASGAEALLQYGNDCGCDK